MYGRNANQVSAYEIQIVNVNTCHRSMDMHIEIKQPAEEKKPGAYIYKTREIVIAK